MTLEIRLKQLSLEQDENHGSFISPFTQGYLFASDGVKAGSFDLLGVSVQTHVTEHHDCAEQQGGGIGQIHSCNIRGSAVDL